MTERQPLLVVFDLDETLVHASVRVSLSHADFMSGRYPCIIRPYARELIAECLDRYEVGVWTSAGSLHADSVVEALFAETRGPAFVCSLAQCTPHRDFDTMEDVSVKIFTSFVGAGSTSIELSRSTTARRSTAGITAICSASTRRKGTGTMLSLTMCGSTFR